MLDKGARDVEASVGVLPEAAAPQQGRRLSSQRDAGQRQPQATLLLAFPHRLQPRLGSVRLFSVAAARLHQQYHL
jgi:hypothetical protein